MKEYSLDLRTLDLKMDSKTKIILLLGILLMGSLIFSGAVSAASLGNTTQPKFHHDNNNTGQSQYTGPQTNTTKWKYKTGDIIFSSPALAADGTVYVGSEDGYLYALNGNGALKWKYQTGGVIYSSPAIAADGTIYLGNCIYAKNNGINTGYLYAINCDGTLKWKYQTGSSIMTSSPAIGTDGTIYVGSEDDYLYAINSNGTLKWRYQTEKRVISSPAIGTDGTIYVGSDDNYLYAINSNGTLKWKYQTGSSIMTSSPALGADGTVYVGSEDDYLYAINSNGTLKWKYQTGSLGYSSPAIGTDGTIYVGSLEGDLYAINRNGTLKWKYQLCICSSPVLGADGTVYVGSLGYDLYAINSEGTLKWIYETEHSIYSSPVIDNDNTLYVSSLDTYLYAITDLKVSASHASGNYAGSKQIKLSTNVPGTIYYEIYNSNNNISWTIYTSPITIKSSCILAYYGVDLNGNTSPIQTETYNINYQPPTVTVNLGSGVYTSKKIVLITTNSDITTITYYTLDGSDPQTSDTRQVYSSPITISNSSTLRFSALDSMGNWSPEYTQNYIVDTTPPNINVNVPGGNYNTSKSVTLTTSDPDSDFTTYYTTDGTDPQTNGSRTIYSNPISITKSTTLRYIALDTAGNWSPSYTQSYIIDTKAPIITANPLGGLYNTSKNVTLTMNEPGTIYYTLNGTIPTNTSNIYKGPITISNTSLLKYIAIDLAGNQSPLYNQTYTIDKTTPHVNSTTPTNNQINVSKTVSINVKYTKNIKKSSTFTKITLKNLTTGKNVTIKVTITNNTLTIKSSSKLSSKTSYQVSIPKGAVKDYAENNMNTTYTFKFKTGG
ncbi:MAG: PQQ-binding-like beta-propeller repeat protein [Methanobacterium sp. ERen5]|nr:MAG: PQQ-binding-like beta-propeller repeat protein [Methanobacterium sp. ERen5]